MFVSVILALAAAVQSPQVQAQAPAGSSSAAEATVSDDSALVDKAYEFIHSSQPAEALPLLDGIIGRSQARYSAERRQIYTARSPVETLYYTGLAASRKRAAVVIDETWSLAIFLKGFALIDLNRADEAKPLFDQAIAMAPMNSHYLGERAEWYKSRRDWPNAYAEFQRAAEAADLSPEDLKSFDKRRGWRGMAYVRIEQGKLDEAETLLRRALALDPSDASAQHELDYIKSIRH